MLVSTKSAPCTYDMAIIAMQGWGCIIRKYPCIARSVLSGQAVLLYCSPHNHEVHEITMSPSSSTKTAAVSQQLPWFQPPPRRSSPSNTQRQRQDHHNCHRWPTFATILPSLKKSGEDEILTFCHFGRLYLGKYQLRHTSHTSPNTRLNRRGNSNVIRLSGKAELLLFYTFHAKIIVFFWREACVIFISLKS